MAQWSGFGVDYHPENTGLRDACFAHFDQDRDGVLNEKEFRDLCCDLFTVQGWRHVVSPEDSTAMMKFLCEGKENEGIDKEGFGFCWKNWFNQILSPKTVLIVVDVQTDFVCGSMDLRNSPAGQDGAEVIPVINGLFDLKFDAVVYTKDYHPPNHMSFFDNLSLRKLHPSSKVKAEEAKMFDTVVFDRLPLVDQTLWPIHCVVGTKGAELHPDLKVVENSLIHFKGTDPDVESYSAFIDNTKRVNTALVAYLRSRDVTDIYVCGLAADVCVANTAMDAQSLGYRTMVIEDASRGVGLEKIEEVKQELLRSGCVVGRSEEVPAMLSQRTRHPRWGLVAARNAAKARTSQDGHQGVSKLDSARRNQDHNSNATPTAEEIAVYTY